MRMLSVLNWFCFCIVYSRKYYLSYEKIMTLLIDAIHCLISSDEEGTLESRSLNTELADHLKSMNTTIIVITNARGDNYKKLRELLADYKFETFTLENNPPKTDPEYFAHVLVYYGLDAQECHYLDHSQDNLDAANELEIPGIVFVDNKQAIETLKSL